MTHADTHTTLGLERITASLMHAPSPRLCHVPFRKLYTVYTRAPLIFIITAVFYLQLYSVSLITHLTHSPQTSQTGRTVLTVVTSQCGLWSVSVHRYARRQSLQSHAQLVDNVPQPHNCGLRARTCMCYAGKRHLAQSQDA